MTAFVEGRWANSLLESVNGSGRGNEAGGGIHAHSGIVFGASRLLFVVFQKVSSLYFSPW